MQLRLAAVSVVDRVVARPRYDVSSSERKNLQQTASSAEYKGNASM